MEILYRSLHNLDLSMDNPVQKEIPSDFDSYIAEYIRFATSENKASKMYFAPGHYTTVMHCVADLTADINQLPPVQALKHCERPWTQYQV